MRKYIVQWDEIGNLGDGFSVFSDTIDGVEEMKEALEYNAGDETVVYLVEVLSENLVEISKAVNLIKVTPKTKKASAKTTAKKGK